jgi:hypothetical protein
MFPCQTVRGGKLSKCSGKVRKPKQKSHRGALLGIFKEENLAATSDK